MADYLTTDTELTSIANAIRTKGGTSANLTYPTGFVTAIGNIPTGTSRTSSDLEVSGATVTAPAGLYASAASKSVASGTAGTPTATKGTVSNHSVSVTPSVTNTTGYITGSTKTGTAVTVSASELVSGTKSITANGAGIDVTDYASVDVAVSGGGGGGGSVFQYSTNTGSVAGTSYASTGVKITVETAGTYTCVYACYRGSGSGTSGARLYKNGTAIGTAHTTGWNSLWVVFVDENISLSANDEIEVYARSRSTSYSTYVLGLTIVKTG